eukprot:CAMPEP_0205935186 /NCGR_PEP_ID=MMETSP1325-20131115/38413_1 /ASSEMBLY_ACC=CAM_ASM_000708 /TAXON_ID=236786 /ORGANISM="Florenciella sp., Strain RCC1007" /LENGTH=47 /DNA_ID= /DNA_START= /DNA_END= /DNA_ORIENTATION=
MSFGDMGRRADRTATRTRATADKPRHLKGRGRCLMTLATPDPGSVLA